MLIIGNEVPLNINITLGLLCPGPNNNKRQIQAVFCQSNELEAITIGGWNRVRDNKGESTVMQTIVLYVSYICIDH